jgi:hypothetical protein
MREINRLSNFSKRTDWNTEESDLARAHRERLAKGLPVVDLTASNPTRCGFNYASGLLEPLSDPRAFDYDPDPRGSRSARLAVCNYYADQGIRVSADDIILTVSTSEAYSYLLKLLCNPGDAILVPQPSYPLFDFLADAEVVGLVSAPLIYDHGWQIDMEGLRQAITERTRAVVLVHPNNPTGHYTKAEEGRELAAVCRERGLALIVDEVFLDYGLDFGLGYEGVEDGGSEARTSFAGRELDVLTFVVSGLSKICGLPQMKSSWLLAKGPGAAGYLPLNECAGAVSAAGLAGRKRGDAEADSGPSEGESGGVRSAACGTGARTRRRQSAAGRGWLVCGVADSGDTARRGDCAGVAGGWSVGASGTLLWDGWFGVDCREFTHRDRRFFAGNKGCTRENERNHLSYRKSLMLKSMDYVVAVSH